MATFTYSFTMHGKASIEADHEGEARLTVTNDLRDAIAEAQSMDPTLTDNNVALAFAGFAVGGIEAEAPAMVAMLRKCADWFAGGSPDNEPQADDIRAILARIDAAPSEPRDFSAELAAASAAGDWVAHGRIWEERRVASVEADEQQIAEPADSDICSNCGRDYRGDPLAAGEVCVCNPAHPHYEEV